MSDQASANIKLDEGWKTVLGAEFAHPYMAELKRFLLAEKAAGQRVYPNGANYFRALDLTPIDKVKVVIYRDANRTSVTVTLGRQPASPQG